jgi:predicted small integral membrane protein
MKPTCQSRKPSAYRFVMVILGVLIFVAVPDPDIDQRGVR